MKNSEALRLYETGKRLSKDLTLPNKFSWALAMTMTMIENSLVKTCNENNKPSNEYSLFEKSRYELCLRECTKDADGKPIVYEVSPGVTQYTFQEGKIPKSIEDLIEANKDVISDRDLQIKRAEENLEEEYNGGVYMCKRSVFRDDVHYKVSADDFRDVKPMLIDDIVS